MNNVNKPVLHHVEILCSDIDSILRILTVKYDFSLFATRITKAICQYAVQAGSVVILLSGRPTTCCTRYVPEAEAEAGELKDKEQTNNTLYGESPLFDTDDLETCVPSGFTHVSRILETCTRHYASNTVIDVSFDVTDLPSRIKRIKKCCGTATGNGENGETASNINVATPCVLVEPTVISDVFGDVTYAVIKSCVGNVVHTLIDRSRYGGQFLPGFTASDHVTEGCQQTSALRHSLTFDHVALVLGHGRSQQVITWYEKCFGMQRFFINR